MEGVRVREKRPLCVCLWVKRGLGSIWLAITPQIINRRLKLIGFLESRLGYQSCGELTLDLQGCPVWLWMHPRYISHAIHPCQTADVISCSPPTFHFPDPDSARAHTHSLTHTHSRTHKHTHTNTLTQIYNALTHTHSSEHLHTLEKPLIEQLFSRQI